MGIHSAEYLHQCGFSRPIFSYQRVYFSLFYVKTYIFKSIHPIKIFTYVFHLQNIFHCSSTSFIYVLILSG